MALKRVVVWVEEGDHRGLKAGAAALGMSVSDVLREMISGWAGAASKGLELEGSDLGIGPVLDGGEVEVSPAGLPVSYKGTVQHHPRCKCDACLELRGEKRRT